MRDGVILMCESSSQLAFKALQAGTLLWTVTAGFCVFGRESCCAVRGEGDFCWGRCGRSLCRDTLSWAVAARCWACEWMSGARVVWGVRRGLVLGIFASVFTNFCIGISFRANSCFGGSEALCQVP
ncbi:hypothetical protein TRVL_08272 [Trypanosoma vivax]|nr:hypothetical protein TRVL_08272 [Trypanosoma vivax]